MNTETRTFTSRVTIPRRATIEELQGTVELLRERAHPRVVDIEGRVITVDFDVEIDHDAPTPLNTIGAGMSLADSGVLPEGPLSPFMAGYALAQLVGELNGELVALGWESMPAPQQVVRPAEKTA